ncbi:LysM peptidoglycan-binding domain-containing protein [Cardinium endosymbiont of Tipula unca]|uniref:LysM peptidoglycan-binding domain-containing protein n=1 Tax=Cardinium endosymbiont of Tipula unca TaxID=3066216 RepID=UPI0030D427CF
MLISFFLPLNGWGTDPSTSIVVPKIVKFADVKLSLTCRTRKRIQEKVDQLTKYKRGFNQILERTNLFFPLIEKTLVEENVPDDFKFQALHESMLVGDAVSHTNDVGFWQINKVAALELKLSIDHLIDERMHLIQSTKAAARFLKIHNNYFNSWLGALLAYNRGRVGVAKIFPKKYYGAKVVQLDDKTDDYIVSVIATKLAFQKMAGKNQHAKLKLFVYTQGHNGQKLQDIAAHLSIEEKLLFEHNRWLRTSVIPHNTNCALVVPFTHNHPNIYSFTTLRIPKPSSDVLLQDKKNEVDVKPKKIQQTYSVDYEKFLKHNTTFPQITPLKDPRSTRLIKANGILAVVAKSGDTIDHLSKLVNVPINKFLLINDIDKTHTPIPDTVYYYSAKATKAGVHYHVVSPGEDLWRIAQRYGIKKSALWEKNRMKPICPLEAGRILWLRFLRPHTIPVEYKFKAC